MRYCLTILCLMTFSAAGGVAATAQQSTLPPDPVQQEATGDWRQIALPADRNRLARLAEAWAVGLAAASSGSSGDLAAHGALFDPDVALPHPHPAPGNYQCRMFKLGGVLDFVAYSYFPCRVTLSPGGDLMLIKEGGSQRQEGMLYPESKTRLVFIGSVAWGSDEPRAPAYGAMPERDQVGVFERIGPQRWRLALLWPHQESVLDVLELVASR